MHVDPLSAQITAYLPDWIVWYRRRTDSYWAVPNWDGAPDEMIEAPDVATLDERMEPHRKHLGAALNGALTAA